MKKISAFPVYTIYFLEIFHEKWCLDKNVEQTENGLERGFVKHGLNSVYTTGPNGLFSFIVARPSHSRSHTGCFQNSLYYVELRLAWSHPDLLSMWQAFEVERKRGRG